MAESLSLFGKLAKQKKSRKKKNANFGILSGVDAGIDLSGQEAYSPAEVSEDFSRKPVGLFKALDYLNRGQYAVVNPLRRLTDRRRDTPGEILGSVWKGLSGQERSSTTDVLQNLGWKPKSTGGKLARGAVGLAGDILLDPLTYVDILQLTKLGKAAKVGAALKVGDSIFDLRKAKDFEKVTGMLGDAMKAYGKADDAIKTTVNGFKGIKKATLAKDMAETLGQYGVKSESVKLAKNWYKQFKSGERALLQLSLPRIMGGGSTRVPIIGDALEEKFFKKASDKGRKIAAARMVTDEKVMKAMPNLTDDVRKTAAALNKGPEKRAVNLAGKLYDIGNKKELDKLTRDAMGMLIKAGKEADVPLMKEAVAKGAQGLLKGADEGLSKSGQVISTLRRFGLSADDGLKAVRRREALERVAGSGLNRMLGRTVNDLAYGFNFIAKPLKKVRRFATGESKATANEAIENIKKLLGKDNEKLFAGVKDFEDVIGGVTQTFNADMDKIARIEALEVMTHPIVRGELEAKAKALGGWQNIKIDDITDAMESMIKGTERNKNAKFNLDAWDAWKKMDAELAAKNSSRHYATPIEGLAEETVRRAQNTLRRWNNVNDIHDVNTALIYAQDMMNKMGAVRSDAIRNRNILEGFGYAPHLLADSNARTLEGRLSHHGQTIFEAVNGHRTKESLNHILDNLNHTFSYSEDGKDVLGKDLLPETAVKDYERIEAKRIKNAPKYEEKIERLIKNVENLPKHKVSDRLRYNRGVLDKLNDDVAKAMDNLIKEAQNVNKADFTPDLAHNIAVRLQGAQNRMQTRLVVDSIMGYGVDLAQNGGRLPQGYVMLKDVMPEGLPKAIKYTFDGADELLGRLDSIAVPYDFVRPLQEMTHIAKAEPGAASKIYDWALSVLKPFMLSAPSTQVRNFLSSISMAFAAGDFDSLAKQANFGKCARFFGTGGRMGGDAMVDILGKQYSIKELWDLLGRYGGHDMDSLVKEFFEKPAVEWGAKIPKAIKKGTDWITTPTSKWPAEFTENTFRLNHFISELQNGATIEDAVESIAMHFFDYGDLSRFEQKYMRRIFPFWTFWRKNIEANARYLVTNLGYVNTPYKLASELTQMTEGEEGTFPMEWLNNERQQWLANQGAYVVPWNKKIGTMQGFLPQADVGNIISPKDLFETLIGMVSPVGKIPYELATNKDSFTGREITTPLKPSVYFLGTDMNPKAVHLLRPFRVLSAVDNIVKAIGPERALAHGANIKTDNRGTLGEKIKGGISDVLGFRSYLQDPEEVQLNKRMEVAKLIRRVDQYLEKHPDLDEGFKEDILKNRLALMNELARTKTVGESGVPSEQLLKSVKRKGKK